MRNSLHTLVFSIFAALWACSTSPGTVVKNDAAPDAGEADQLAVDALPSDSGGPEFVAEFVAQELVPEDLSQFEEKSCEEGAGCFFDPCASGKDCQSGYCVLHMGEQVCSQTCVEECPAGFECTQLAMAEPDVVFVCASLFPALCLPCSSGSGCEDVAGLGVACVSYGDAGHFCASACSSDEECPAGYQCSQVATVEGLLTAQCVNEANDCDCTEYAIEQSLSTSCSATNEFGVCTGSIACTPEGKSQCDAETPEEEVCDGVDNDCNGQADDVTCDDGNACTDDQCLGGDGCSNVPLDGGECLDGDACTIGDHCEAGMCVGSPVVCDDQNPCTDEWCDVEFGCRYEFNSLACDDSNPCSFGDTCLAGNCVGLPGNCECTTDEECQFVTEDNKCLGNWYCDTMAPPFTCTQVPGSETACDEPEGVDKDCYVNGCVPETGECEAKPVATGSACDDGDACTTGEQCVDGECTGGIPLNCNDGNQCTDDFCETATGCINLEVSTSCSDGDACTVGDECVDGVCLVGAPADCDDLNPCTDDSCDPAVGCVSVANDDQCDDANACTSGDHCEGGWCVFDELEDCNDDNPCTDDSCDALQGCAYQLNSNPCDDGDVCTVNDKCSLGSCQAGISLFCNDSNDCTEDTCDPEVGCEFVPTAAPCDDGNACTVDDHCFNGGCVSEDMLVCDDDNVCTKDKCVPALGCLNDPLLGACDDGSSCTVEDYCSGGECQPGATLDCDDGNQCTADSCDALEGCVNQPTGAGCDDGDPCTVDDQCSGFDCVPGPTMDCDDESVCTLDYCDSDLLCVNEPVSGSCDDGDLCTDGDSCQGGTCVGGEAVVCQDADQCTSDSCDPDQGCLFLPVVPCCGNGVVEVGEECDDGNLNGGDGCTGQCMEEVGQCFENWLVGTPCNGTDYGNGCSPSDTGYHFVGIYSGYACWWHHKNQAWNTTPSSNFYHLALNFGITPGVGKCSWCHDKNSTPDPNGYGSCGGYFGINQVGAWGWCAESNPNSAGFVCIPTEGHPPC